MKDNWFPTVHVFCLFKGKRRLTWSNDDNHQQHGSKSRRVSVMETNWFPTVHIFCSFIEKRRSTTTIDIIERWQSSTTWIPNDKSECDGKQLISDCPHILFVHRKTTINDHDRHHRTMTIINNMDPKRKSECDEKQLISDCPRILFVHRKTTINDHDRHHRTMTIINNMDPKRKSECDGKQLISDCPRILFVHRKTTINDHDWHHRTMTIINNMDPKRQEWVWWKTTDFRLSTYFVRSSKNDDQRPRSTSSNDDNHQQHGSKSRRVSVMETNWFPTVHIFCLFIEKRRSTTTIDIIERWQSSTTWIQNDKSECDEKQLISDCPHILFVHKKTTINDHDRHHRTMTIINNMDPKRQEWVWWKTTDFRLSTYFVCS